MIDRRRDMTVMCSRPSHLCVLRAGCALSQHVRGCVCPCWCGSEALSVADVSVQGPADAKDDARFKDMIRIPGGTYRMGSDRHYPEEAPAHRVTVSEFWIDRTPITNRQFKDFVRATGHVTFAEISPDPKNYPGALPHMLFAGSLVFTPPNHAVDLRDWSQWWVLLKGANW